MKSIKAPGWYPLPALVAAGVGILYLSFPAARYNFDGVACAIAVELGDLRHLVHGNHLAYGLLGYGWFSLWKLFGYQGPALQCLQVLNSILGAAGAGACALFFLRCGISPALAVVGAAGLAVSQAYWTWSLEAQVYPLGAFFLFWAAAEAVRERPKSALLGFLHAGAVLGHVGHIMFLPVVFYRLKKDSKEFLRYGVALAAALLFAYLGAAATCVRPQSWGDVRIWLLGSAALNVNRAFLWHGGYSFSGLRDWIRISLQLWSGHAWAGAAAVAAAGFGAAVSPEKCRRHIGLCLLWLGGYAILFLAWEPYTVVYRITDLAPLWFLVLCGVIALPGSEKIKTWALALCVAVLGGWNLNAAILPGANASRNADLQRALWLAQETPENAWIVASGVDQVYIPYFAHRKPLILSYYAADRAALIEHLNLLRNRGEPVFLALQVLPPEWQQWFLSRRLEKIKTRAGQTLYKVE